MKKSILCICGLILLSTSSLNYTDAYAEWKKDSTGWWYSYGDSWASGWKFIDDDWYYFNSNGYMENGWIKDNEKWYYMYNDGRMAKSTYVDGYLLNSDGSWITTEENLNKKLDYSNINKNIYTKDYLEDNLVISLYSSDCKGRIISVNTRSGAENSLIDNRDVSITGDISDDNNRIVYVDALNDHDPWQIYVHDKNENKTFTVTNDHFGKASAKISNDNSIYFLTATNSNCTKIGNIRNYDINSYNVIDNTNQDRNVDAFNLKDNKIIMATNSYELNLKKWKENNGRRTAIPHDIWEMDLYGNNMRKITEIQANLIEFISYSNDKKRIVISGLDINGDKGYGIYEVSAEDGKLNPILTDAMLKSTQNSIVSGIAHPSSAVLSNKNNVIYFTGIPADSTQIDISGMIGYPEAVFSYNIVTKEITKIFNPKFSSIIYELNVK